MTAEDCLPSDLRGPTTTLTRIAVGLSGAAVYRVEAAGQAFVLKIASATESDADWRHALTFQRNAADAGLTPRIVHVDEARRAILTVFVADRSFAAFYYDPRNREAALTLLGRVVRRLHALPLPANTPSRDPREFLLEVRDGLLAGFPLPAFAIDGIQRALAEAPATDKQARVFSHNDLNPSNLLYDGESLLLLDWATAGPMDPFYDLAVLAAFLRMDEGTCLRLLSAYDGTPHVQLPPRFLSTRRLATTLAGSISLYLARQMKHPGASGTETLESTLSLGEFYQRMRAGELKLGTPEGQWAFGLALLKDGLSL